jgi:hypothetical protein
MLGLILAVTVAAAPASAAPAPRPPASPGGAAACRFTAPPDLDAAPSKWLGDCRAGAADGLGVLRAGSGEPYAFFAGRMERGRPVQGLLMLRDGLWMAAIRFDAKARAVSSDGLRPELDDQLFAQARAAALDTAARFRRAGNKASADYYMRLARKIVDGRPE